MIGDDGQGFRLRMFAHLLQKTLQDDGAVDRWTNWLVDAWNEDVTTELFGQIPGVPRHLARGPNLPKVGSTGGTLSAREVHELSHSWFLALLDDGDETRREQEIMEDSRPRRATTASLIELRGKTCLDGGRLPFRKREGTEELRKRLMFKYGTRPFNWFSGRTAERDKTRKLIDMALKNYEPPESPRGLVSAVYEWLDETNGQVIDGIAVKRINRSTVRDHLRKRGLIKRRSE
jgi:hypothetical protein